MSVARRKERVGIGMKKRVAEKTAKKKVKKGVKCGKANRTLESLACGDSRLSHGSSQCALREIF